MSERPGEQEPGYPPAPGEQEPDYPPAPAPRPQPFTVDAEPAERAEPPADREDREEAAESAWRADAAQSAWRAGAGTVHSDVPPAPPWRVPTRDTVTDTPAHEPRPPAAEPHPIWDMQRRTPQPTLGQERQEQYPPASQPAEFVTSGSAAASAADTRYAWHSPAAPDWQRVESDPSTQPAVRRRRRRKVGLGVVVLLVLVALLGGVVLGALGARWLWPVPETQAALPEPAGTTATARPPESVAAIAAAALDSTVYIQVRGAGAGSSGSGMVLREDGYVVTNNHVIAPATDGQARVTVTFADGSQEEAQIVGSTADYDLAILKVDVTGLTPLPLADSDAVVVGDTAVAVGAPLGLEGTVTSGIVSALNRPVEAGRGGDTTSFINAIQTDAAINPGNSGGPLLNASGEVIGINTAIAQAAGQQTGSIGLGFAIPSNQVRRTAEQIIETGRATYPVIGVALDTRYGGEGVQVLTEAAGDTPAVTPGGPGDEAGIAAGDIITHFDGQPVTSPSELIVAVRSRAPGDTVVLTVRSDGGATREVEVVLDEAESG